MLNNSASLVGELAAFENAGLMKNNDALLKLNSVGTSLRIAAIKIICDKEYIFYIGFLINVYSFLVIFLIPWIK